MLPIAEFSRVVTTKSQDDDTRWILKCLESNDHYNEHKFSIFTHRV